MTSLIIIGSFLAILFFGMLFADGDGTANSPRQYDDSRVVTVSLIIAGTAAFLAWITHAVADGAYK
jgi:hypothetical protein